MRVLLVEPYLTDSHKAWAEGYREYSAHDVELMTLPGRNWKWRMHGAAVQLSSRCASHSKPDVILASDMLDLATFSSLLPSDWRAIPSVLYFHENQLTYPWPDQDQDRQNGRDLHYAWIHVTGALVAKEIWFNSAFHQRTFLEALRQYLKRLPGPSIWGRFDEISRKSRVMPIGISPPATNLQADRDPGAILWNHRWEYDKNPQGFFQVLEQVKEKGGAFRLIILGPSASERPPVFERAKRIFEDQIIHMGYVDDKREYWSWLRKASWAPVTSWHDFLGLSVMESASAGVVPFVPERLSYPEIFARVPDIFYQKEEDLVSLILHHLGMQSGLSQQVRQAVSGYHWPVIARRYDTELEKVCLFDER